METNCQGKCANMRGGGQTAACSPLRILQHVQFPSFLQIKLLLTTIPRAKTFSIIYSAALQMLPFFWTFRKLASSCPTPVRHKQVCVVQHYFLGSYLKPLLIVSTHISPSPCGTQLFSGNQRPDPFHTCVQVSGGQKDPGITALVQPQQISELSACQHYLASRMETEAHSSHYNASGDTDTQAVSESLL